MFDFKPDAALSKPQVYAQLLEAAEALTTGEEDAVANMANVAALLWEFLPGLNWAGFYRMGPSKMGQNKMGQGKSGSDELVLGPFNGRPACIRIPLGHGVCGTAAQSGQTQCVEDVHAFPGHIACDAASQSELVVPVMRGGTVIAVIDLDSPDKARFDSEDAEGIEALAAILSNRI